MRQRPAAVEAACVDDFHSAGGTECLSWNSAAASPPSSQNGAKYCSDNEIAATTPITSETRTADANKGGPSRCRTAVVRRLNASTRYTTNTTKAPIPSSDAM